MIFVCFNPLEARDNRMMNPRFFCPDGLLPDLNTPPPLSVAHHVERVPQGSAVGDPVVLFRHKANEAPRQATSSPGSPRLFIERESSLQITVQALASGDKMDWIVQKAVELGVRAAQPRRPSWCRFPAIAVKRKAHQQQIAAGLRAAGAQPGCWRRRSSLLQHLACPSAARSDSCAPGAEARWRRATPSDRALAILIAEEGMVAGRAGAGHAAGCVALSRGAVHRNRWPRTCRNANCSDFSGDVYV